MKRSPFQKFLSEELMARIKKNPQYSIRAFARDLAINDSTLSQLMNGKRLFTSARIKQLGKRLNLSDKKVEQFLIDQSRGTIPSEDLLQDIEKFNMISEWYYDAIIELVKIPGINLEPKSVGRMLGITAVKAKIAIEQLKKLEMIAIDKDGKFICQESSTLTNFYEEDFTSEALKYYQDQLLELSRKALATLPKKVRNHTSHVIAIDSNMVAEINDRIRRFQHELATYIEANAKNKDKVYAIQFSSFPITRAGESL